MRAVGTCSPPWPESTLAPEVVLRHHGPLGPILRERHAWLQDQGLLEGDVEEMLVIRGRG